MRTFMDTGAITPDGEFYDYAGLFSFARPVQERLPIYLGAMRGPKSLSSPARSPTAATTR